MQKCINLLMVQTSSSSTVMYLLSFSIPVKVNNLEIDNTEVSKLFIANLNTSHI